MCDTESTDNQGLAVEPQWLETGEDYVRTRTKFGNQMLGTKIDDN